MVEMYSLKRGTLFPYNTLYFIFQTTPSFGQKQFHCIEHMVMREIINLYPFLDSKLRAVTTCDYIKFQCFDKTFNLDQLSDFINSQKWLTESGFKLALSEIKQEDALSNQTSGALLETIKGKKENYELTFLEFYDAFQLINNFSYLLCSEGVSSSSNFRKNFLINKDSKRETHVDKGMVPYNGVNFFYRYMMIPMTEFPNLSSIYFLQDFTNTINQKMHRFRNLGIYYSFCFCKYYKKYVELYIVVSENQLIKNFESKVAKYLEEIYRGYDYIPIRIGTNSKILEFKEDLVALYLSDEFAKTSEPLYNQTQKDFIKKIICLLGGNCGK